MIGNAVHVMRIATGEIEDSVTDEGTDTHAKALGKKVEPLIVSCFISDRSGKSAIALMDDLWSRLANRVQLTTDFHRAYLHAVEGAFGGDVDYAQTREALRGSLGRF